jgi:hypothetical protein
VPPDLELLKVEEGSGVVPVAQGQPIVIMEKGMLGLDVKAESPTWLYVFAVFGASDEEPGQSMRPVYPATFEEYATVEPEKLPAARGVELASGEHQLACANVVAPQPYEGLLVYACPRRNEVLDQWQKKLLDLELDLGAIRSDRSRSRSADAYSTR